MVVRPGQDEVSGHQQGTSRRGWTRSPCHEVVARRVCWDTPQHPGLGAVCTTKESAFGLVEVEHSPQLAAGFDKAMRTVHLISNEGNERV